MQAWHMPAASCSLSAGTEGDMRSLCCPSWLTASLAASSLLSTSDKAIQVIDISISHLCKLLVGIWLRRILVILGGALCITSAPG